MAKELDEAKMFTHVTEIFSVPKDPRRGDNAKQATKLKGKF